MFTEHTIESAPAAARRSMTATISHNGYLPTGVALMATSPELLDGFLKMSAAFDGTTLDPIAREVVIMTMATGTAATCAWRCTPPGSRNSAPMTG